MVWRMEDAGIFRFYRINDDHEAIVASIALGRINDQNDLVETLIELDENRREERWNLDIAPGAISVGVKGLSIGWDSIAEITSRRSAFFAHADIESFASMDSDQGRGIIANAGNMQFVVIQPEGGGMDEPLLASQRGSLAFDGDGHPIHREHGRLYFENVW
jgi:hypothetical protein